MGRKHIRAFGGMVDLRRSCNVPMTNSKSTNSAIVDAVTDTSQKVVIVPSCHQRSSCPMELRLNLVDVIHTDLLTIQQRQALAAKRSIKNELGSKQDLTISSLEAIADDSSLDQSTPKDAKKDFKSIQSAKHRINKMPNARKKKSCGIRKQPTKKVKKNTTTKTLCVSPCKESGYKIFECNTEPVLANGNSSHPTCVEISGKNKSNKKSQTNKQKKRKTTNEESRATFPLQTWGKEEGRKNGENLTRLREANSTNETVHMETPTKMETSSSNESPNFLKVYNTFADPSKQSHRQKVRPHLSAHTSNLSIKVKNPFHQTHLPSTLENTHDVIIHTEHHKIDFLSHINDNPESQSSCSLLPCMDSPFCKIHIENSPYFDNKDCNFESITRAIDNDMATGNRLSLPADCNMLTSPVNPLSISDVLEVNRHDNKHRRDKPIKSPKASLSVQDTSFQSSLETTRPNTSKRKCPEIINDDLLPKDTIAILSAQSILHVDKKQRNISPEFFSVTMTEANRCEVPESDNGVADANHGELFNNELLNSGQNRNTYPALTAILNNNNFTNKNNDTIIDYEDSLNNNLRDRFIDENARTDTTANGLTVKSSFMTGTETTLHHFLEQLKASSSSSIDDESAKGQIAGSVAPPSAIHESKEMPNSKLFENTTNAKVTEVEELTEANLHRFNVITAVKKSATDLEIVETPIKNLPQIRHGDKIVNGNSADITRVRKRKWLINNQKETSSAGTSSGIIKLNRKWKCEKNRFLEKAGEFEDLSRTSQASEFYEEGHQLTSLNCRVETNIQDRPIKNNNKNTISYSCDFVEESINNDFQKLNSPVDTVQKCRIADDRVLPAFGASNSCNIESITKTQTESDDESSTSSSSSSLSMCSSTSSSDSSDEKSTDEIAMVLDGNPVMSNRCNSEITDVIAENIEVSGTTEEHDSITLQKVLEVPTTMRDINGWKEMNDIECLRNKEKNNDPAGMDRIELLRNNEEIKDLTKADAIERLTIDASQAVITMETPVGTEENNGILIDTEIDLGSGDNDEFEHLVGTDEFDLGSNLEEITDRHDSMAELGKATSSTENADCTNRVNESDEDDCISLFAESICMSARPASPRLHEISEHRHPPNTIEQYTNMKADNIETFVAANKHECRTTFEEYTNNAAKSTIIFESRPINQPLQDLMKSSKVPNNVESKSGDKVDLRTTLKNRRDVMTIFRGQCYAWLRTGNCKVVNCRFDHKLKHMFQNIEQLEQTFIEEIITFAINNRWFNFFDIVQEKAIMNMPAEKIMAISTQLYKKSLFTRVRLNLMVAALRERGLSHEDILSFFKVVFDDDDRHMHNVVTSILYQHRQAGTGREIQENESLNAIHASAQLEMPKVVKVADCSYEIASPASPKPEDSFSADETVDVASFFTKKRLQTDEIKEGFTGRSNAGRSKTRWAPLGVINKAYQLQPIDRVPPPKSPYGNNLWKFHLDLAGVQQGLKYRDYAHVIRILKEYSKFPNRLPHIAGFYDILCAEIMLSKHHWTEILRLTVELRSSDELCQYVYDLGIYVLTKLADTGAWIHAYDLLKAFRIYGTYNTCAFTLLAAEICIANQRPLKALTILKQSRIIFANTRMWQHIQCPGDKALRVSVINLLLQSLCYDYPEHALALLEFIVFDQACNFQPINICRHVDAVARCILSRKQTSLIQDLSRLILEAQLSISTATFRALINRVFHDDPILAKQLHRYATWLGCYNIAKINGASCVHIIINADCTEEETYLMISSLIDDLYMNIGHAVGRLKPRQLNVFLVIEEIPSERQLSTDIVGRPTTRDEVNKRRAMVKSVLERFDPKIKILQKSSGKVCKLQSASLVEYLKSGQLRH